MAINWIRDLIFASGVSTTRGYMPEMWLVVYHMLRCAGYRWIWECDGHRGIVSAQVANHVADGNMEAAGVANWTAAGAPAPTVSKSSSTYYSGTQSLEITGQSGGEVQSAAITSPPQARSTTGGFLAVGGGVMRFTKAVGNDHDFSAKNVGDSITFLGADSALNDGTFTITGIISSDTVEYMNISGITDSTNAGLSWWIETPIHLAIWVHNPGSQTWNVDVDRGDAVPVTVGSFAGTTGWEVKHFDFDMKGNGNVQVFIRPQGTSETIHIDSILMFRSFFEFTGDYEDYADGDTGAYVAQFASDEFESSNYTFVGSDVGKFLFLFDKSGNYPKNTGCYSITGINAGRAVVDLRSLTASFSSQDGSVDALSWRMVDIYKWAASVGNYMLPNNRVEVYNGFGLESPDTSKWRFVCRGAWCDGDANNVNGCVQWSAPHDVDLDVDTGNFFKSAGPSIIGFGPQRNKTLQDLNMSDAEHLYTSDGSESAENNLNWMRGRQGNAVFTGRHFMMFDDEGKWFFVYLYPDVAAQTAGLFGLVGQDAYHPGDEAHCHLSTRDGNLLGGTTIDYTLYTTGTNRWWYHGKGISKNGQPARIGCAQIGYGSGNAYVWEQTNAQPNPFSGDEWVQPVMVIRGSSVEGGWSEREAEGLYQCRANMLDLTVFGNENGTGDSFSLGGTTITLTDAAGVFTVDMVGKVITITGATTPGNNGTFTVTGVPAANTLTYENAAGATEAFTGTWSVNMAKYLHLKNSLCLEWMGERLVP